MTKMLEGCKNITFADTTVHIKSALNEESSAEVSRFVKKVEHYSSRYGNENIQEHAPKEKIDFLKRYAEEKRREEDKTRAVPQINSITN